MEVLSTRLSAMAEFPCRLVSENTYVIKIACSTILTSLCQLAYEKDEESRAFCIRHHPHDEEVTFHMGAEELAACLAELHAQLLTPIITPGGIERECFVRCPSFWLGNLLRRALYTRVEVLCVTSVRVVRNTSSFEDALIAHRCGQLALQSECPCALGTLCVEGRDALGKDIAFDEDVRVAPGDVTAPIVSLGESEAFEAELVCSRGRPLSHSKFHSVAAPSYYPDVRLSRDATADERALLSAEYVVAPDRACTRKDGLWCRPEVLEELLPKMEVVLGPGLRLGVESLGQYPPEECVRRAIAAIKEEAAALAEAIRECDRLSAEQGAYAGFSASLSA